MKPHRAHARPGRPQGLLQDEQAPGAQGRQEADHLGLPSITVTVSPDVAQRLNALSGTAASGSRSHVVEEALRAWLQEQARQQLERQVEAYYRAREDRAQSRPTVGRDRRPFSQGPLGSLTSCHILAAARSTWSGSLGIRPTPGSDLPLSSPWMSETASPMTSSWSLSRRPFGLHPPIRNPLWPRVSR